jgi:hypothetical protein
MKEREKKKNERKEKERPHPIRLVPFEENFFCSLKKSWTIVSANAHVR